MDCFASDALVGQLLYVVDPTFVYDTTAGIPAVIKEGSVYYIREPNGSLITRVSSSNTSYYHFDQLGSTRLLTDGSGNVTDEYAYDAYGSLLSHNRRAGSVDQPYQYIGELGYYTHYQEPEFRFLQLGVRFYDAEVGRFTQRDPIVDNRAASFSYAKNRVTRVVDPDGQQAIIYPTLVASSSCKDFHGAAHEIAAAQALVQTVVDGLNLYLCPATITVYCYNKGKCGEKPIECGKATPQSPAHMHINWAPPCSSPMCLILHEMVHNCGRLQAGPWEGITVPGCMGRSSTTFQP